MNRIIKNIISIPVLLAVTLTLHNYGTKGQNAKPKDSTDHPKHQSTDSSGRYNYAIIKPMPQFAPSSKALMKMIQTLQGSSYVWAEERPKCFDCSGYTYYLCGKMGIEIPRVS